MAASPEPRPRVLIVDDEAPVRFTLSEVLDEAGFEVLEAESAEAALALLDGVEAVISDISMPGMSGLELLQRVQSTHPMLPVLMLTARGSERVAVAALKAGAADYLTKPYDIEEVVLAARRAVESLRIRKYAQRLEVERAIGHPVVADSPPMRRLLEAISRVASRDVTVLVSGETGTGKELVGALLHAQSKRAAKPLVRFNCGAISASLAESELFGHASGAFTGATHAHQGFFSRANGGTLILDEVSELPLSIQSKLLRALQEQEIQPVGGHIQRVNVRVVACSNQSLLGLVQSGQFRADLYYRLAVVELRVPSLRERPEDIPGLVALFVRRYCERFGVEDLQLSKGLVDALTRRFWGGNVRELENCIARLVALSPGGLLGVEALSEVSSSTPALSAAQPGLQEEQVLPFRHQMESFERQLLVEALKACEGNQSEAARRLGLSRSTLIDKLKRHNLLFP